MEDNKSCWVAGKALRERSRLNQILLDSMPCIALLLKPSTREIVASNQAAVKVGAVPGKQCFATWGKRENPCPWCLAPALWETGEPQHLEVEALETVWDAHWAPVGPDLYMHYAFDITGRKRAEQEIARLASFPQLNPNPVIEVDLKGNITFINPAASEAIRKNGLQSAQSLLPADLRGILQAARKTGKTQFYREIELQETVFGVHIFFASQFQVFRLYLIDITPHKRIESALRQSEEKYRFLVNQIPAVVFKGYGDWSVDFFDRKIETLTGFRKEEFDARTITWRDLILPEDRDGARRAFIAALRSEKSYVREYRIRRKDGKLRWIQARGGIFCDAAGKVDHVSGIFFDITDRKRTEEALRESEEKYRLLVSQLPAIVFQGYGDWSVDFLDRKVEELTGYHKEDFDSRQVKWCDLIPPEGLDYAQRVFRKALKGDKSYIREHRIRRKDGEIRWVQCRGRIFCDDQGNVKHISGVTFDITDRKRAEEALRKSEELHRSLFENMLNGFAYCKMLFENNQPQDFIYLNVNRSFEVLTGLQNVVGKKVSEVIPGIRKSDPSLFEIYGRVALTGKPERFEIYVEALKMWFSISVYSPEKEYFVAIFDVITDRRRAEEALRNHLNFLQTLLETIPSPIFYKNTEGVYLGCNQALADFLGLPKEEVIAKTVYDVYPQDLADKYFEMDSALFRQPGVQIYDFSMQHADGTRHDVNFHKATYTTTEGKVAGLVGVMVDITERKKAEEERLRFSKLESLANLAGGIAHDFNNILTAIIGNISLAMLDVLPEARSRERLIAAERACLQAQTLARQLLTFAKGGAPIKEVVSVQELVTESGVFACSGSPVRCESAFPDNLWMVEADPGQTSQVFQNLIINAIQAMPMGGTIRILGENLVVETGSELALEPGRYVKISIQDQGVGIPANYLPKIFDPYFTTKQTGSGLGLATAYSIVKNHHGHISVESKLGEGTVFHVYFPALENRVFAAPEKKMDILSGSGKILVMDDEEIVRQVLAKMLGHLGYEAEFAKDGEEAVQLFTAAQESGNAFDVVILDLTVPGGMGGREVLENLLKIEPQVKAIVSSGYSDDPIMADFTRHGFSAILAKPYKISELSNALQKVLQ
jgi:PAS domain S-box-containing protein